MAAFGTLAVCCLLYLVTQLLFFFITGLALFFVILVAAYIG